MLDFERNIAVDMGTSSTLLFEQGKGVVAREPTVVAVDKFSGKILKIGQDAQKMLGRTPANIVAIHPISAGVISDYEISAQMLRELVSRITSFSLLKPRILVCVPSSITGVEERAMIDAAIEAGGRRVYLLETAVATALGAICILIDGRTAHGIAGLIAAFLLTPFGLPLLSIILLGQVQKFKCWLQDRVYG